MTGLLRGFNKILIIGILIWGALILFVRLAAPLLEHARQPLQDSLSKQLNTPITIEHLHASWYGVSPVLRLQGVQIGEGKQSMRLHEARVDLTLEGLKHGKLLDSLRLTLDRPDLHLQREKNGQVHIIGLPLTTQDSDQDPLQQLPSQLRLHHTRLHWHDKRVQAESLVINNLNLELRRQDQQLNLRGNLDSPFGNLEFAADIDGYLRGTEWSGNSYLRVGQVQLAELMRHYLPDDYQISNGILDLEIWQQWEKALPVRNTGSIYLSHAQVSRASEQPHSVALDSVSSNFQFQRDPQNNWTLELDRLRLQPRDKVSWPSSRLVAQLQQNEENSAKLKIAAEYLSLDGLAHILLVSAPGEQIQTALAELQPQGVVRNLRLELPLKTSQNDWRISADFEQLTTRAWGNIPGLKNFRGRVAAQKDQGQIDINSRDVEVDYRSLFRDTHFITSVSGTLFWQADEEKGWTLYAKELPLDTADFTSKSQLQLTLPVDQPARLYLQTEMRNANVAKVSLYLPSKIMGARTVQWLDESLSTGHVDKATLLLDGPLKTFPYAQPRDGVFEIVVNTQDTALDYLEGWPPLHAINAKIEFHEKSLDINASSGQIFESQIERLSVNILDLTKTTPLILQGQLNGPLNDHLRMLQSAPLRDNFGHISDILKAEGNAGLKLAATIPLNKNIGKYKLDGALLFKEAKLELPDWQLPLDRISGQLNMSLKSLQAKGIKARALGTEITVDVIPQADRSTSVVALAHLDKATLAQRFPDVPLQNVQGSADFAITLHVPPPGTDNGTTLNVASDLYGIAIDLPVPLGKTAILSQNLKIQVPLTSAKDTIEVDYADEFSARLSQDLQRGDVRYRAGKAQLVNQQGYEFTGNFNRLNLADWQFTDTPSLPDRQNGNIPWQASIKANELTIAGFKINDAWIQADSRDNLISGKMNSTQVKGDFRYIPSEPHRLEARLIKAHIVYNSAADSLAPAPGGPDPHSLPIIDLVVDDLIINQAKLGQLQLHTIPAGTGLEIDKLRLTGGDAELDASGTWILHDQTPYTLVNGTLKSSDLGELLHNLGYSRQIHDAAANSEFDLSWIGHPGQAHKETVTGTLDLAIQKGRLSELDPGLGRALGLLSLNSIGRRLKLDFADVLKKGYTFDSIEGSFRLEEGNAYTNNLNMNGPAGHINIGGRIGLVDQDFDQIVQITPHLDATLPIASTLAGGPVAGVAALLAQQLLSEEVDLINRFEYSVNGSWEEPEIVQLDSGGTLSKIINSISGQKTQAKTLQQETLIAPRDESDDVIRKFINALEPTQSGNEPAFEIH